MQVVKPQGGVVSRALRLRCAALRSFSRIVSGVHAVMSVLSAFICAGDGDHPRRCHGGRDDAIHGYTVPPSAGEGVLWQGCPTGTAMQGGGVRVSLVEGASHVTTVEEHAAVESSEPCAGNTLLVMQASHQHMHVLRFSS